MACRILCDFCQAFTTEKETTALAWAHADRQGWGLVVKNRKKLHRCPRCKEKNLR